MSVDQEESLAHRAAAGDRDALSELLLRHHDGALALVRFWSSKTGCGTPIEPEDVLQEAFVRAVGAIHRFQWRGPGSFGRWLAEIARNQFLDCVRRQAGCTAAARGKDGDDALLTLLSRVSDGGWSPARAVAATETADLVRLAVSQLRPDYRDAIAYRYMHGMQPREIARIMGRSRHDIHNLCHRALAALREALGRASLYLSRG
jgi:RNA polymerase sigma-70 factor (ECF subfamily)